MHGFYSQEAADITGFVMYENKNGESVKVTAIFNSKSEGEERYKFPDSVYVGPVTKSTNVFSSGIGPGKDGVKK